VKDDARYSPLFTRRSEIPESFWISLRYFSFYRIAIAAVFFGASLYYEDTLVFGAHNLKMFRSVAFAYMTAGLVLHVVLRNMRDLFNLQLTLQVCLDVLAIALLMNASGGMKSGLGVMLFVTLTGSALVAPRRLTILYAALASIALLIEQTFWVLVFDVPTASYVQPGLMSIGFFATAGVTGFLAQRVGANEELARQRGRELANQMRVNQLVIEDMHDGVIVLDRAGRVLQHNPRALQMIGRETLRGTELAALVPGFGDRWRAWQPNGEQGGGATLDVELNGRDVRLRMIETGTDEDLAVIFVEDVTRSREQAQQLKLAALGRLTANIAHEIRNPLSAISHATELLAEESRAEGRERLYRIVHDNTRRLERLVADVLQLNRRDRSAPERIQVGPWLMGFVEDFAVNESVRPELFALELSRDALIEFDREHLRQVMWNLLRNAVRHARGESRCVRVTLRVLARQVELNVIDDGPGVAAAHQGQLFEPFFTTDSKGTGLGLYLARELCSANRAVLEYVDDVAGAHFRVLCREAWA
jgi:two-component system sensor histidine kinase PilS (NtrC family)